MYYVGKCDNIYEYITIVTINEGNRKALGYYNFR